MPRPKPIADQNEVELKATMKRAADAVKVALPPKTLFTLLVFDESKIGQYISNVDRRDMIKVMRETADRLERNEDIPR